MKRAVIFQIGRLDPTAFYPRASGCSSGTSAAHRLDTGRSSPPRFAYEGHEEEAELSGLAVAQALGRRGYDARVFLFFPVSLPFNGQLSRVLRQWDMAPRIAALAAKLRNAWRDEEAYLGNPEELFGVHPHVTDQPAWHPQTSRFAVIPASGAFPYSQGGPNEAERVFVCRTPIGFVRTAILVEMLAVHLALGTRRGDTVEYYCDVSSGLNVQTTTMAQAFADFAVCMKLSEPGEDESLRFHILGASVIGGHGPHQIERHDVTPQAFFEYPCQPKDYHGEGHIPAVKTLYEEDRRTRGKLRELLLEGARAWACVHLGLPLALAYQEVAKDPNRTIQRVDTAMHLVIDKVRAESKEACKRTGEAAKDEEYEAPLREFGQAARQVLFSLSLYRGIGQAAEKVDYPAALENEGAEIEGLKTAFEELCKELRARYPRLVVSRELSDLRNRTRKRKLQAGQWVPGEWLFEHGGSNTTSGPDLRNVIAHAGLERTLFEVQPVDQDRICVRYRSDALSKVWEAVTKALRCNSA